MKYVVLACGLILLSCGCLSLGGEDEEVKSTTTTTRARPVVTTTTAPTTTLASTPPEPVVDEKDCCSVSCEQKGFNTGKEVDNPADCDLWDYNKVGTTSCAQMRGLEDPGSYCCCANLCEGLVDCPVPFKGNETCRTTGGKDRIVRYNYSYICNNGLCEQTSKEEIVEVCPIRHRCVDDVCVPLRDITL